MGTIKADVVLTKASILLVDRTKKQWPDQELLGWLNDGQLEVCLLRPDAYTAVRSVLLDPGTRQQVPDLRLLDITRNLGQSGQTPGRAIRYLERSELDLVKPTWHNQVASNTVRHWCYDQRTPKVWWCYPPQPATSRGYVELLVSAVPPAMTVKDINGASATTALGLDDIWMNPLLQFTVYRAMSKDNEYAQPGGKAHSAWQEFLMTLGLSTESAVQFDPKRSQPPQHNRPAAGNRGAFGGQ